MTVVKCRNSHELVKSLYCIQNHVGTGKWYFRGQGIASWGLTPSLFRVKTIHHETAFEHWVINRLRSDLTERSALPQRLLDSDDYLLALAQHYRCPTRLLDWTLSPLVAAYFAAANAVRQTGDQPLAVFAINDLTRVSGKLGSSVLIKPMRGANENIAAQRGVLIKHDWPTRDLWQAEDEKEVLTADELAAAIDGVSEATFFKLELAGAGAAMLLEKTHARGVDGVTLFPGSHGFAEAAADFAWLQNSKGPYLSPKP